MANRRNLVIREYRPTPNEDRRAARVRKWIFEAEDEGRYLPISHLKLRAKQTWRDLDSDEVKMVVAEGIRTSYPKHTNSRRT